MIVFSEIKRCQHPHSNQFFQKAKKGRHEVSEEIRHLRESFNGYVKQRMAGQEGKITDAQKKEIREVGPMFWARG